MMKGDLSGIRVLELTHVWSGPLAGRVLADLGAEVIHIRSRAMVDNRAISTKEARFLGTFPDDDPGPKPWERHTLGNDLNRNKLGLTLELNTDAGKTVFTKLVNISDVVLDNFSPRVMKNLGLDYPLLKDINPGIIACSMPGFGLTGPQRDQVSFGTTIEPASGLSAMMGYKDGVPMLSGNPYPDPAAAMHMVGAILTALVYKQKTGEGQQIDLSQCESATCLMGEWLLECVLCHRHQKRRGNRHHHYAPCGCYPCKGDDKWVVIEIHSEDEWQAVCRAMGHCEWENDDRFLNASSRMHYHDDLDHLISAWTSGKTPHEVMHQLQKNGVRAGAVLNAEDLFHDPHLKTREFFKYYDKPGIGRRAYAGLPFRFRENMNPPVKPAPFFRGA